MDLNVHDHVERNSRIFVPTEMAQGLTVFVFRRYLVQILVRTPDVIEISRGLPQSLYTNSRTEP